MKIKESARKELEVLYLKRYAVLKDMIELQRQIEEKQKIVAGINDSIEKLQKKIAGDKPVSPVFDKQYNLVELREVK